MDTDPNPEAPGIYLGDGATPFDCFEGDQNDLDHDDVGDYCEKRLALAFDPQMVYSNADNVGREPRWAVRLVSNQPWWKAVGVFYAMSYYVDLGTHDPLCENFVGATLCRGHYGDSEYLILTLSYNEETSHWVVTEALLSQHGNNAAFTEGSQGFVDAIQYASHSGAAPRIWSAWGKHANYQSATACDNGAFAHLDDCIGPYSYEFLGSAGNGNLGSSAVYLIDCVSSSNPFYSSNPAECYWSGGDFSGWQNAEPAAPTYGSKLIVQGF